MQSLAEKTKNPGNWCVPFVRPHLFAISMAPLLSTTEVTLGDCDPFFSTFTSLETEIWSSQASSNQWEVAAGRIGCCLLRFCRGRVNTVMYLRAPGHWGFIGNRNHAGCAPLCVATHGVVCIAVCSQVQLAGRVVVYMIPSYTRERK